MIDLFGFVISWDDPSITPNTIRLFAKKVPVTAFLENYTKAVISRFHQDGIPHIICCSNDFQRGVFSISEYFPVLDIVRCLQNATLIGNTILLIKVVHKRM